MITYQVLIFINGIGKQVKNTVIRRKNFLPQTSDRAPIRGALKNDKIPCKKHIILYKLLFSFKLTISLFQKDVIKKSQIELIKFISFEKIQLTFIPTISPFIKKV